VELVELVLNQLLQGSMFYFRDCIVPCIQV
jgi:hypothetical protein